MPRTILHLDLDAFFCSVEELHRPELKGRPFAVGGRPDQRGVVASCSYAARHLGVRSAMPMARALRLCPSLLVVSGHYRDYSTMSDQVMDRLHRVSGLVEQISIDEAFLDVSDTPEPVEQLARRVQTEIHVELSLPCSVGVAGNKLVAKIATEVGKKSALGEGPPMARTIVPAGAEAAFLAPLPAEMLWGVGPKTAARLAELGIRTIGDLARWPEKDLETRFGEWGRDLARRARGEDLRPVVSEHDVKSMSQETTFARDVSDDKELERTLRDLAAQVGRSLRRSELAGKTVKLKLRWPDFTTLTRQSTLSSPTDDDVEIFQTAVKLLHSVRKSGQPVRLVGVGVSALSEPIRQLGLWDANTDRNRRLQDAVDQLRERYGREIIQHAKTP